MLSQQLPLIVFHDRRQLLQISNHQQLHPAKRFLSIAIPPQSCIHRVQQKEEGYIRLTKHNYQAQKVNDRELASLSGKAYHFRAEIEGDFPEYSYPADELLTIKEGAQIMFLKNDPSSEKRYYNGMIGEVVTVNDAGIIVRGKGNKSEFQLLPEEWGN